MSQPGMQPRWASLEDLTRWRLRSGTGHLRRVWMAVTPGPSFGPAMVMTPSATPVTNTVPTLGPAIRVGLIYQMLGPAGLCSPGRGRRVAAGPAADAAALTWQWPANKVVGSG
jgi:hypothetical protein